MKKPALTAIKTVPDGDNPGDDFTAQVVLRNDGLSRADQVTVTVNSSSGLPLPGRWSIIRPSSLPMSPVQTLTPGTPRSSLN
jgi:hypothetical protein